MSRINPDLLTRLQTKLGVQNKRIYELVKKIANERSLDRHLAALILAGQHGISIQKYSTADERAQIRGAAGGNAAVTSAVVSETSQARKRTVKTKSTKKSPKDNSVFVVHGRNEALRKSMFEFLRALGLNPMEWSKAILKAKGANPHIDDVLDAAMGSVQAVVVLFSPDDEAKLKDNLCSKEEKKTEGKLQGQPRPNVIFEAGLALGRHPEKTLLVQVGKIREISDIGGKHIVRLSNDHGKRNDVANRLRKIGCLVDTTGSDWTTVGDFSV